ncbi:hypothetical protein [Azospirillum lipoferum]|uniref:Uncharacterized protein n=1 Tax=Azospirillum lipoferum (strain 4B) TaxID=862719 RepID=G7Z2H7_AZOL4|nr:hypothetical protein [Azospirillum lipoferum]CBS85606.1 protein of unknown function [Azospirillum lipoferum 4B]
MSDPEPQTAAEHPTSERIAAEPNRGRSRWRTLGAGLLLAPLALGGLAVLAVLWSGTLLYDRPFAWYNLNRIGALADRAARSPDSVSVVALGDTALRDATLDERGMAELAARRGVANLEFLRIVHPQAQFADFEPLLDRLVAVKPTLILIDRSLLTASRSPMDELERYGHGLMRLYRGQTHVQDQVALQYRRGCGPTPSAWLTGGTPGAVTGSSATARQVRAFIDRAWATGIRVALIEVHSRPAPHSTGPVAAASAAESAAKPATPLPLWNYAAGQDDDGMEASLAPACPDREAGADGRSAFSAWLTGGIAGAVAGAQPDRMPGRAIPASDRQRTASHRKAVSESASLP